MTPCVHPAEPEGRGVQRVWGASGLVPGPRGGGPPPPPPHHDSAQETTTLPTF